MKRKSGIMILVGGLLSLLGCFLYTGLAAASGSSMTVTATNDLVSAQNVGYTLTFSPITAVDASNRIVLSLPAGLQFPSTGDGSAVTISDGNSTVHPSSITQDGNVYISVNTLTPLSGTITVAFAPSFGIGNPTAAGNYSFGLRTDLDNSFVTADQSIGTTSTFLQSLSIDQSVTSQTSATTYSTVTSSTYGSLIVHAVPVDPTAAVSVTGATYLGGNTYNTAIINQTSFSVTISTTDSRTAVYVVSIIRQYDIAYVNFVNHSYTDGVVSGTVSWAPPAGGTLPAGADYRIAFFNDANQLISTVTDPITSGFSFSLPATAVPEGATRLGVVLENSGTPVEPKSVPIWRSSNTSVLLRFQDLDPAGGSIDGQLSWQKGTDDSQIAQYQILYQTRASTAMQLLDTVSKNDTGTYTYSLSNKLPADAVTVMIGFVNRAGEIAPSYPTISLFDDRSADSLSTVATNNLPAATNLTMRATVQAPAITGGQILWTVPAAAPGSISSFNLYFTDSNGTKLKPIGSIPYDDRMSTTIIFNPYLLGIPPGATHIAVYTAGFDGSESALSAGGPIGLSDLNNDGVMDLSDLILGLKHSANLSIDSVSNLLARLMAGGNAVTY